MLTRTRRTAAALAVLTVLAALPGTGPASAHPTRAGGTTDGGEATDLVVTAATLQDAEAVAASTGGTLLPHTRTVLLDRDTPLPRSLPAGATVAAAPRLTPASSVPTDPMWPDQDTIRQVAADSLWAAPQERDVVVAVVDTGFSGPADMADTTLPPAAVADYDTEDQMGHGTAVATVIGAAHNDHGIAGACTACKVWPIQVFADDTESTSAALVTEAVRMATASTDPEVDVINLSLAGPSHYQPLDNAIAQARAAGIVVVAAAGNEGTDEPLWPGASPGSLSVAGVEEDGDRSFRSSHGDTVDVAAGMCMLTGNADGSVRSRCGTSFASPLVAAIVGQLISAGVDDPVAALTATATPVAGVVNGLVDAAAAWSRATDHDDPLPSAEDLRVDHGTGGLLVGFDVEDVEAITSVQVDMADHTTIVGFDPALSSATAEWFATGTDQALLVPAGRVPTRAMADAADSTGMVEVEVSLRGLGPTGPAATAAVPVRQDGVSVAAGGPVVADVPAQLAAALADTAYGFGDAAHVTVAAAGSYADSLAAAPLLRDGPLLLVDADTVDDDTLAAVVGHVRRLLALTTEDDTDGCATGVQTWVLGGEAAVPAEVADHLSASGLCVRRLAGAGRIDTALAVTGVAADRHTTADVVLVTAGGWADAAAAAGWAASAAAPVLLTPADTLPDRVAAALADMAPARIWVIGGEGVVSAPVAEAAATAAPTAAVTRVAGQNRVATAAEVATHMWGASPHDDAVVVDGAGSWTAPILAGTLSAVAGLPIRYLGDPSLEDGKARWQVAQGTLPADG